MEKETITTSPEKIAKEKVYMKSFLNTIIDNINHCSPKEDYPATPSGILSHTTQYITFDDIEYRLSTYSDMAITKYANIDLIRGVSQIKLPKHLAKKTERYLLMTYDTTNHIFTRTDYQHDIVDGKVDKSSCKYTSRELDCNKGRIHCVERDFMELGVEQYIKEYKHMRDYVAVDYYNTSTDCPESPDDDMNM